MNIKTLNKKISINSLIKNNNFEDNIENILEVYIFIPFKFLKYKQELGNNFLGFINFLKYNLDVSSLKKIKFNTDTYKMFLKRNKLIFMIFTIFNINRIK